MLILPEWGGTLFHCTGDQFWVLRINQIWENIENRVNFVRVGVGVPSISGVCYTNDTWNKKLQIKTDYEIRVLFKKAFFDNYTTKVIINLYI